MDYIPNKNAPYTAFVIACSAALTASPAAYGIDAPRALSIATKVTALETTYSLLTDPRYRTPVVVQDFADQRAILTAEIRAVNAIAQALPADSTDLVAAGFNVRSTTRTPQAAVTESAENEVLNIMPMLMTVGTTNPANPTSKKKPAGTGALEVVLAIGTTEALDPSQAQRRIYVTKTPYTIATGPDDRGKVLVMWTRWQSLGSLGGKKVYGPYSLPTTVRLP